jgi:cytochrome P450
MTGAPTAPAYLGRHAEFHPDPSVLRLQGQAGIASVSTPFGHDAWLVTRHADVREVLGDSQRFSIVKPFDFSRRLADEEMPDVDITRERAGDLLSQDPPEHTRLRALLAPTFTMRRVRRLQPWIERVVADHPDRLERASSPAGASRPGTWCWCRCPPRTATPR